MKKRLTSAFDQTRHSITQGAALINLATASVFTDDTLKNFTALLDVFDGKLGQLSTDNAYAKEMISRLRKDLIPALKTNNPKNLLDSTAGGKAIAHISHGQVGFLPAVFNEASFEIATLILDTLNAIRADISSQKLKIHPRGNDALEKLTGQNLVHRLDNYTSYLTAHLSTYRKIQQQVEFHDNQTLLLGDYRARCYLENNNTDGFYKELEEIKEEPLKIFALLHTNKSLALACSLHPSYPILKNLLDPSLDNTIWDSIQAYPFVNHRSDHEFETWNINTARALLNTEKPIRGETVADFRYTPSSEVEGSQLHYLVFVILPFLRNLQDKSIINHLQRRFPAASFEIPADFRPEKPFHEYEVPITPCSEYGEAAWQTDVLLAKSIKALEDYIDKPGMGISAEKLKIATTLKGHTDRNGAKFDLEKCILRHANPSRILFWADSTIADHNELLAENPSLSTGRLGRILGDIKLTAQSCIDRNSRPETDFSLINTLNLHFPEQYPVDPKKPVVVTVRQAPALR